MPISPLTGGGCLVDRVRGCRFSGKSLVISVGFRLGIVAVRLYGLNVCEIKFRTRFGEMTLLHLLVKVGGSFSFSTRNTQEKTQTAPANKSQFFIKS